jgi:site-specific DNA-methyltransferase (adenine-specific)
MRQIVRASLPLGEGVVLDPFMGGGSTIAAAVYVGYESIGIEHDRTFFQMAVEGIPKLATPNGNGKNGAQRGTSRDVGPQRRLALPFES